MFFSLFCESSLSISNAQSGQLSSHGSAVDRAVELDVDNVKGQMDLLAGQRSS